MKKFIFLFLISICINSPAQPDFKRGFRLGMKGGLTSAKVSGGRVKTNSRITFTGGFWVQLKMNKHWTAQVEVLFVEKGIGGLSPGRSVQGQYAISLFYFEAPVLFQYHIKKFAFEAGPGLGVCTYQHENLVGAPSPNLTSAYPFDKKEFSFNLGLGYAFNEKWYLGLRFIHSLLQVRKQIPDINKQVYNRVLALSLARNFRVKKKESRIQE